MTIRIRRMQAGDELHFAAIGQDVFDEAVNPEGLAAYLAAPGHLLVLAFDGELVVGQCAAVVHRHPDKATELYVDEVGTASTHRRLGIARRMIEEMFGWGREVGCHEAWLGTELDNGAANALYRSLGGQDEAMAYYEFKL